MIILLSGISSLVEFLKLERIEPEIPKECRACGGRLWRNGSATRICLSFNICARIIVPRVVCVDCRKTGTCLFDFLAPHKRYEGAVRLEYVSQYLETEKTYRDVAWGDADGDNVDAEASVSRAFRAMEEACDSAEIFLQQVQQELVESGEKVPELDVEPIKATRAEKKQRQLVVLTLAMQLAKRFCGCCVHSWLLLRRHISAGYPLRQLGFRLSAPRTLKQRLF
jgi:hypothetical protein